jgi:hypothetical protein
MYLKNSIVGRLSNSFSTVTVENPGSEVIPFSIHPTTKKAYQDYDARGEPMQEELPWFKNYCEELGKKNKLALLRTEHRDIDIICPSTVTDAYLVECLTLAILADIFLPLVSVYESQKNRPSLNVPHLLTKAIEALNGENNFNHYVGLFDCKHGTFICRRDPRLSGGLYRSVDPNPVLSIMQLCNTPIDPRQDSLPSTKVMGRANKEAYSFLKESFFK